jgi:hypothetical protein
LRRGFWGKHLVGGSGSLFWG